VLYSLKPVTFRYNADIDAQGLPQFGLVAEDVDKVAPDLVVRDEQHGIYTVRYQAVEAMLLNEFIKQHRKVEAQQQQINAIQAENACLRNQNQTLERRMTALETALRNRVASKD
jgi:hypothetical protein